MTGFVDGAMLPNARLNAHLCTGLPVDLPQLALETDRLRDEMVRYLALLVVRPKKFVSMARKNWRHTWSYHKSC